MILAIRMRHNDFILQECYQACSNLDLKQFTLSPDLYEDDENHTDDAKLFLEYDKQQIILAQIASFDKASHRYSAQIMRKHTEFLRVIVTLLFRAANLVFLEEKKQALLNRQKTSFVENEMIGTGNSSGRQRLRSVVENDVDGLDKSSRVQLSRFIKEEVRGNISRNTVAGERRSSFAAENINATALRRSTMVRFSITSSLDTGALKLSSLVGRCVYTSEVGSQSFFYFRKFGLFDCACSTLEM